MITDRERYEMEFRAKTFEMLLGKILKDSGDVGKRIATLRLFYQNFPDRFNPRVFFDALNAEARLKNDMSALADLKSLAYEISRSEVSLVEVAAKHEFENKWVEEDSIVSFAIPPLDRESHPHTVSITLREVDTSNGVVYIHVDFGDDLIDVPDRFQISYFDTPFTDYTILPDGHRIAITLKDTGSTGGRRRVKLKVIEFPHDYLITGDRPSAEAINHIIEAMEGKQHASASKTQASSDSHHHADNEH